MTIGGIALLGAGLVALLGGAELLVRGASRIASSFGISPLVIGLTLVAFGTSSPELAASLKAVAVGQAEIAVGNVVGSNIFNVLVILGLSAVVTPLAVQGQLLRLDVPLMIGASAVVVILAANGVVGRFEGLALLAAAACYTSWLVRVARREPAAIHVEFDDGVSRQTKTGGRGRVTAAVQAAVGLGLLVLGSGWLVTGAAGVARAMGVTDLVIGLTLVAAGTSLPELATSVVAAMRGQREIAVGNVVGSNIFNLLVVLGATAAVSSRGVGLSAPARTFDLPFMLLAGAACVPIFISGSVIARWEGWLFLAGYGSYLARLVLDARGRLPPFLGPGPFLAGTTMVVIFLCAGAWMGRKKKSAG